MKWNGLVVLDERVRMLGWGALRPHQFMGRWGFIDLDVTYSMQKSHVRHIILIP